MHVCLVFFQFFNTRRRDWLGRTSPKWPSFCQVGRKTLTQLVWPNYFGHFVINSSSSSSSSSGSVGNSYACAVAAPHMQSMFDCVCCQCQWVLRYVILYYDCLSNVWLTLWHCSLSVQTLHSYLHFVSVVQCIAYSCHRRVLCNTCLNVGHTKGLFVFWMDYRTIIQFLTDFLLIIDNCEVIIIL